MQKISFMCSLAGVSLIVAGCSGGPTLSGLALEQKSLSKISDSLSSYEAFEKSMEDNASFSRTVYIALYDPKKSAQDSCSMADTREDKLLGKRVALIESIGKLVKTAADEFPDANNPDSTAKNFDTFNQFNKVLGEFQAAATASAEVQIVLTAMKAVVGAARNDYAKAKARKILSDPKNVRLVARAVDQLDRSLVSSNKKIETNFHTWAGCERLRLDKTLENLARDGTSDIQYAINLDNFLRQEAAAKLGLKQYDPVPADLSKNLKLVPEVLQNLVAGTYQPEDLNAAAALADTLISSGKDLGKKLGV